MYLIRADVGSFLLSGRHGGQLSENSGEKSRALFRTYTALGKVYGAVGLFKRVYATVCVAK